MLTPSHSAFGYRTEGKVSPMPNPIELSLLGQFIATGGGGRSSWGAASTGACRWDPTTGLLLSVPQATKAVANMIHSS